MLKAALASCKDLMPWFIGRETLLLDCLQRPGFIVHFKCPCGSPEIMLTQAAVIKKHAASTQHKNGESSCPGMSQVFLHLSAVADFPYLTQGSYCLRHKSGVRGRDFRPAFQALALLAAALRQLLRN